MVRVSFELNGESRQADVDPSTPLLYVLRDESGLNSPRYGCGLEQCGACRVLVDGEPEYSCTLPVEAVSGRTVRTVEGLGHGDTLAPLQQAFLDENAAQCGYCTSGILIAAAHLLSRNPDPDRHEIASALEPHLCRCGSHNRVIRAIRLAATRMGST